MVTTVSHVRLCATRDLPKFDRFGSPHHVEFCRAEFARGSRALTILVAVDSEDEPIGKLHLDFEARGEGAAVLVAAAVSPALQRRGVGTELVREAETFACRRGTETIVLGVEDSNPGARRLYERLGYEAFETGEFAYSGAPTPNPGVWMRKRLEC